MRKGLKVLHSLASCGLIGGLGAYMIVLAWAPQASAQQYADLRQVISLLSDYVLIPSLGVALVTGLLAMMVQRAFQQMRWVWVKAVLGFALFESTLAIIQSKATYAAKLSAEIASSGQGGEALATALAAEWTSLTAIMALSVTQVVLGVWRPSLKGRSAETRATSPRHDGVETKTSPPDGSGVSEGRA